MKEYLKQIKKIDTQIRNKSFELKQLKENQLPAGQVLDEMAKLQGEKQAIIKMIEQLPEADYDVLHKIYVQYETLYEVAADRGISYSLATTIHGRALKKLEKIVNEKEKEQCDKD